MSRRTQRVQDAAGYLLHSAPWRETSLIIQVFTRHHGNVALVAKGAKRPYSVLRPVLSAFQPLSLSWSGANEVRTLTRAECAGIRPLGGRALMSAWYMNELLLRLLAREDPHPVLYDAYDAALQQLAFQQSAASALRRFEWILLNETGYGLGDDMPDFDDPQGEPALRQSLRERLNALLGRPLQTRKVLMELQRY
ncbi:DNA repair protein RecO [Pollutimonas thiosulfatoxidans]|uniref:DNA repair protein RecO n=1 Tax=Pollutimonas thiosulfatoxidans TaxID=2028345 RepID=A0A410G938_9BURK|nr:DNA repair protein RecO [Pollutimonas thiosulfatoxidans]MBF6615658.1 DNA repair protein RecO [Candidimonas sp.]QAA92823.1 DNA repair protein RecO [Pollutimonas thiosulfatoxidans]